MSKKQYRRHERCFEILELVAEEKGSSREFLARRYHCSLRTIAEDIKLLKQLGFKIRYTKRDHRYYIDGLFPFQALKQKQILELFLEIQLLTLNGSQIAEAGMLSTLSETERQFVGKLSQRIYLAPGGKRCSPDILSTVYWAIAECRPLRIQYKSFSKGIVETFTIEPYGIYMNYRGELYVVCKRYDREDDDYPRLKVCRMLSADMLGSFEYPDDFSLPEEMKNGFWGGGEEQQITLKFTRAVAQLVYEREPEEHIQPLPDGSLLVRRTVRHVKEVLWEVLSYEANVEVLAPEELRGLVKDRIEQMRQVYERGLDINRRWQDD